MKDLKYIQYNSSNKDYAKTNRKQMTKAEKRMRFDILKSRPGWHKFLRQKMIWSFILDFYCSKLLLCIEVDGNSHNNKQAYDAARTSYLNDQWIQVVRYTNTEVLKSTPEVYADLMEVCRDRERKLGKMKSDIDVSFN